MVEILDRSPYAAAEAVVRTLAKACDEFRDEDSVWARFAAWSDQSMAHIDAIRGSRHTIFYYEMQQIYEFAVEHAPADIDICFQSGKTFMEAWFSAHTDTLIEAALASPHEFQKTVVDTIRRYVQQYSGDKYMISEEFAPDGVSVTLEQDPAAAEHLRQYDLDPVRCFRNAFHLIAGTIESWVEKVVKGYEASKFRLSVEGERGTVYLPVPQKAVYPFEDLTHTLLGYVREVEARQQAVLAQEQRKSDLMLMQSDVMRDTMKRIRRASRTDETLLLRGESGTGKSYMARRIHDLSARRDRPFVVVATTSDVGSDNLVQSDLFGHERGAFTGATGPKQGLFSLADGGTIFLDEIGDATPELQAKLLRVIETSTFKRLGSAHDMQVDVRVIAATNRNLERMIEEKTFRKDLYYRLCVIPLSLPPLRERPEDIPAMAEYFLANAGRGDLPPELADRLKSYPWPGNLRELNYAMRHAAAMADRPEIGVRDFPEGLRQWLEGAHSAPPPEPAEGSTGETDPGTLIDEEALRAAIRSNDPAAHIESAKRLWLATLIDETGGDLQKIARYWDRGSEKTLRKLIRAYDLGARLDAARRKRRESS